MNAVEWIQSTKWPAFLGIGATLAGLYYFSAYDGGQVLEEQIKVADAKIKKNEEDLSKAKSEASDKVKFQEKLLQTSTQLTKALDFLPTSMKVEEVLDKIASEASVSGVKLKSSTPKQTDVKGFYEELKVDIEMEGSYGSLLQFLANISAKRIRRIITLRNLEMERLFVTDPSVINLKMRGTLIAYKYIEQKGATPPGATPPSGPAGPTAPNPGAAPK